MGMTSADLCRSCPKKADLSGATASPEKEHQTTPAHTQVYTDLSGPQFFLNVK